MFRHVSAAMLLPLRHADIDVAATASLMLLSLRAAAAQYAIVYCRC